MHATSIVQAIEEQVVCSEPYVHVIADELKVVYTVSNSSVVVSEVLGRMLGPPDELNSTCVVSNCLVCQSA